MARRAAIYLCADRTHAIDGCVDLVTIRAGEPGGLVRAAFPVGAAIGFMAVEAHPVLQTCLDVAAAAVGEHVLTDFAVSKDLLAVFVNRAVAGFTLQASGQGSLFGRRKRRAQVAWLAVNGAKDLRCWERERVIVAAQADIRPAPGVVAFLQFCGDDIGCIRCQGYPRQQHG